MTSDPATWPVGAYVNRDNPSTVYVFALASAPGGRLSAIRVGGVWKPSKLTEGDLAEDFKPVASRSEVDALVKAART